MFVCGVVVCCLVFVVRWLLCVVCFCSLCGVRCLLSIVVGCLLCVCCFLFVVCCAMCSNVLFVVCCVLFVCLFGLSAVVCCHTLGVCRLLFDACCLLFGWLLWCVWGVLLIVFWLMFACIVVCWLCVDC